MKKIKSSRTGIAFAAIYGIFSALFIGAGLQENADPKGAYILLHIPTMLQEALIYQLGGGELLMRAGWGGYILLVAMGFAFMYVSGWLTGKAARAIWLG